MAETGRLMAGMTLRSLRKTPTLIPLITVLGTGIGLAFTYLGRLAFRNTDTSWDHHNNPQPWVKYGPTSQYKFYAARHDYGKLKYPDERPDMTEYYKK